MAQQTTNIVCDPDVLHGEPRIDGRRVSVRQIAEWIEEAGLAARTVADRQGLDVADVYAALAYYHSHPDEMAAVDRRLRAHERAAREQGAVALSELRDDQPE